MAVWGAIQVCQVWCEEVGLVSRLWTANLPPSRHNITALSLNAVSPVARAGSLIAGGTISYRFFLIINLPVAAQQNLGLWNEDDISMTAINVGEDRQLHE